MWESSHTMSSPTPRATQGSKSARMYTTGEVETSEPMRRSPKLRNRLPSTLLNTTTAVNTRVFNNSRADSVFMRLYLIARTGCGRLPCGAALVCYEFFSLGPQGQVLPGFLGQSLPFL